MVAINRPVCNVEDGLYTLRIGKSKIVSVSDFTSGEQVERIEFTFLCTDGPSEGEEFTDLCTSTTGERSKLGKIYRAAMKTKDVPSDWDTDDLTGKRFLALVQGNDNGYARISLDSIKPAQAQQRAAQNGKETPVGQTFDEAKRKAKLRQAELEDAQGEDDDTWNEEGDA